MDPTWRYKHGIRPTLRHLMILVVGSALLSAAAAPLPASVMLPLAPALLVVLLILFDRPGPAKYWLAGLLGSLTFPAVVAWGDWVAFAARPGNPGPLITAALAVLNVLAVTSLV